MIDAALILVDVLFTATVVYGYLEQTDALRKLADRIKTIELKAAVEAIQATPALQKPSVVTPMPATRIYNGSLIGGTESVTLLLYDANEQELKHTLTRPSKARPLTVTWSGSTYAAVRETASGAWVYRRES